MFLKHNCALLRKSSYLLIARNASRPLSSCIISQRTTQTEDTNKGHIKFAIKKPLTNGIGSYCLLQRGYSSQNDSKVVEFLLADIGEGIQEVIVREWFVKEGDTVKQFDNICEVQSDKASVTITSRYDGIVSKLHYNIDDTAYVGKPLIQILVKSDGDEMSVGAEVGEQEAIPVGEGIGEGTSVRLPSPKPHVQVLAIPMVRRFAKDNNVDIGEVVGTGRDGRVLKEDVMRFIARRDGKPFPHHGSSVGKVTPGQQAATIPQMAQQPAAAPVVTAPIPPVAQPVSAPVASLPASLPILNAKDRTEPIKGVMSVMVKTMTEANKVPHFLYCDEVNLTDLVAHRKGMREHAAKYGIKFSYMPLFIKAASMALLHFPILNASVDKECKNITYKAVHNIGMAMDTSQGLLVPNIKGVQGRTVLEIAQEINRLFELGQKGALAPTDMSHGTFTLSNIGSIGGTYAKPILMPSEVAIGALGKIQVLPRYTSSGSLTPAHIMQVSWSADHRVIDGATMARFSNMWKDLLEDPTTMCLHMK